MRILFLVFLLSSCGYNNTKLSDNEASGLNNEPGGTALALDFATVKSQVFQNFCLRCHSQAGGNRGGINLESYSTVKPLASTLLSVVNRGAMPPTGVMPVSAKNLLMQWIQSGAPEVVSTSPEPPQNSNPAPSPQPSPCDQHIQQIEEGVVMNLDREFYFDLQSKSFKRRHDDCEDRLNKTDEFNSFERN